MSELRPPRRWQTPLLLLSLAINLLIVGIIIGWLASPDRAANRGFGTVRGLVGEPFLRALPPEHRRSLIRDLVQEAPRIRESRESLRLRFEAFLEALVAEPFDPDQVSTLLSEQRAVALRRQDIGERFLLERLTDMSVEERQLYAANLKKSLKRLRQPLN